MSAQTSARIKSAIATLHFAPNFHVRAMRQHRTRILGVVSFGLGQLDDQSGAMIAPAILTGIDLAADAEEHDILLYTGWTGFPDRISADRLLDGHIDGLLWAAPRLQEPIMEQVAHAGIPLIALLARHVQDNVGYVNVDNIAGMELIVRHLVSQGRTCIAFLGPAHASNWIDRRDGYRLALNKFGLEWDPGLEATAPDEKFWDWSFYEKKIKTWLAGPKIPDAIVAAEDGFARSTIELLDRCGVRIPEDIAVTGFNDSPFASSYAGGLTTIRQDFRQIGQIGAERLIALVEGAPVEACRVTLAPELVVRATTARKS